MVLSALRVIFPSIFLFEAISSTVCKVDRSAASTSHNYDMLVLSQSWPQSSCWSVNQKWENHTCNYCKYEPKSRRGHGWTIHGLWPSNRNGKHVGFCDKTKVFDPSLIDPTLRAELDDKWPNLNMRTNKLNFWKHEWSKHGTCALNLESTNSLQKYFTKSIELLDAHNVGDSLARSGIVPRTDFEYNVDDVVRAVEGHFGHSVTVACARNKKIQKNYLEQIYICFDKSFRLTDCEAKSRIQCHGKHVIYPKILKACS